MTRRVLAIGLDGYEPTLGDRLMAEGDLPALAGLAARSARFRLDHGSAVGTGLAWEQFSSGLSPQDADKWAAVAFDPETYEIWQVGAHFPPFPARLRARTAVFDPPYFDIAQAPMAAGIVNWGAHDPGVPMTGRPGGLLPEFLGKFGAYPAKAWIYGNPWPTPARTREMGEGLAAAVDLRAEGALWLLGEKARGWDLGIVVVSELHSAVEGLWHGLDPAHPLHALSASTREAGEALRAVHRAVDRLVGRLCAAFPDAAAVTFAMNGMGPNTSDVASMLLLPELLYRHAFGGRFLRPMAGDEGPARVPLLKEGRDWLAFVAKLLPEADGFVPFVPSEEPRRLSLDWMPGSRYRPFWPRMQAFALPSFYDGRIRINLAGRECAGRVPVGRYDAVCREIEALLGECRDPISGDPSVASVERVATRDPLRLGPTESDLVVTWKGPSLGLDHPRLGRIGPLPYRRPGGHTGPHGMAWLAGTALAPGDCGVRSSFDVAPTLVDLLGEGPLPGMSGRSLLDAAPVRAAPAPVPRAARGA